MECACRARSERIASLRGRGFTSSKLSIDPDRLIPGAAELALRHEDVAGRGALGRGGHGWCQGGGEVHTSAGFEEEVGVGGLGVEGGGHWASKGCTPVVVGSSKTGVVTEGM